MGAQRHIEKLDKIKTIMRYLILCFILFITISCISDQKNSGCLKTNNKDNSSMVTQSLSFRHSQKKRVRSLEVSYLMENDTLMQMIRIHYLSQSEILYKIYVKNKKRGLQDSISGIAKAHLDYDPEIDEDIDGTAYPAIEFNDKQKDYIYIRIEAIKRNKIQINANDCLLSKHPLYCPFSSQGILFKSKLKKK